MGCPRTIEVRATYFCFHDLAGVTSNGENLMSPVLGIGPEWPEPCLAPILSPQTLPASPLPLSSDFLHDFYSTSTNDFDHTQHWSCLFNLVFIFPQAYPLPRTLLLGHHPRVDGLHPTCLGLRGDVDKPPGIWNRPDNGSHLGREEDPTVASPWMQGDDSIHYFFPSLTQISAGARQVNKWSHPGLYNRN